jgi:hypothetical protein
MTLNLIQNIEHLGKQTPIRSLSLALTTQNAVGLGQTLQVEEHEILKLAA